MNLLAPLGLAALAVSIPLLVLYMLKSRRQRVEVPSLVLWEGAELPVTVATPWQRLRRSPLLLLQLAALGLFALLLARPFGREASLLGPHTVLVIDSSGSMAMANRLGAAQARAIELVADASDQKLVSIVEAGPVARVHAAFGRDPKALQRVVAAIEPTGGTEDLAAAIRLARGLSTPDRPSSLVLLTDGGVGPIEQPIADAEHLVFDERGPNQAISAFTVTAAEAGARAFLEVTNHSQDAARLTVEIEVGGLSAGALEFELGPGLSERRVVPIEAAAGEVITARLLDHTDSLGLDDAAVVVMAEAAELGVGVVGEGSVFLQALLDAVPGFAPAAGTAPDLVVIDGGRAATLDRPAWIIASSAPPPGIKVVGRIDFPVVSYQRPGEPLLEGIDFSEVGIAEAQLIEASGWLVLVRAGADPLVLLGEVDGQRAVYFAFDITSSDLPLQVGFPVLGARILQWLAENRGESVAAEAAGVPIRLALPEGGSARVTDPAGVVAEVKAETPIFEATGLPGLYAIQRFDAEGLSLGASSAVRSFVTAESAGEVRNLSVRPAQATSAEDTSIIREWAPWLLGALLALLLVEWWEGHGRPSLRRGRATRQETQPARVTGGGGAP